MEIQILYTLITLFLLIVFVLFELVFPARKYEQSQKKHSYVTNVLVFIGNNVVTYLLQVSVVALFVSSISPVSTYFLLMPIWMQAIVGVVLLDFSIWAWHLLNHKNNFLWRFHKAHHSEQYLNATSALRFHIGELLLSVVWKAGILLLFGIPLWVFFLSEFLLTVFAIFHHANIAFSKRVRNGLAKVIITPHLHRAHHSEVRHEHDTNYGVIFSWWDSMFKTLHDLVPERIGLKGTSEKTFLSFLLFPFNKK